jgi:hypothetical protein
MEACKSPLAMRSNVDVQNEKTILGSVSAIIILEIVW